MKTLLDKVFNNTRIRLRGSCGLHRTLPPLPLLQQVRRVRGSHGRARGHAHSKSHQRYAHDDGDYARSRCPS